MKFLIVIIFFCAICPLFGQIGLHTISTTNHNQLYFGLNISYDLAYRNLSENYFTPSNNGVIKKRNEEEIPKSSFSTGLKLGLWINSNWSIESGILYSGKGYQTKTINLTKNFPDPNSFQKYKLKFNCHYLDIPFKVNYFFGQNKLRLFTSLGVTINFLLEEKIEATLHFIDKIYKREGAVIPNGSLFNISPTASIGIDYKWNKSLNFRFEQNFQHSVLNYSSNSIKEYLFNVSSNIGIYYKF